MTKVNFSGVSDFKPIPEGEYEATFTEFTEPKPSKASGQLTTRMTYTIQDDEFQGRKVFQNLSFAEAALWNMKRTLIRLGANEDVVSDPEGFDVEEVLSGLVGSPCRVVLVLSEYQGVMRNAVQEVKEAATSLFG